MFRVREVTHVRSPPIRRRASRKVEMRRKKHGIEGSLFWLLITHYFQLSKMVNTFETMKAKCVNMHMAFVENDEGGATVASQGTIGKRKLFKNITFLHKVAEGTSNSSYGLNVARILGFSEEFINRAAELSARTLECQNG